MVEHLRQQGKPSVGPNGACLYRGPDGTKCAIGALIPDECYNESLFEGRGALTVSYHLGAKHEDSQFFRRAQTELHDNYTRPSYNMHSDLSFAEWLEVSAASFAEQEGLMLNPPKGVN